MNGPVEVIVGEHVIKSPISDDSREKLTHTGVRAIGLKLFGRDGLASAADLPMSLTAASLQAEGTVEDVQHRLNMLNRAGRRAGHLLNTVYGIPSKGDGDDLE